MPRPKGSKKKKKKHVKVHTKQHQHQQQKQRVNVNINTKKSKSSDDEEKKEKKRKVRNSFQNMMIPNNIIFNPSLSIPQGAPINKPGTNPPFYDMNSLIQAMQPAQPQPTPPLRAPPTTIMDQIQQVTTNISTTKDKIKDEIKPINPVIPEPIPQYVPNPQSDQSNPIPPDILIDSNISTPIHNKHMAHKNLKKEVQ